MIGHIQRGWAVSRADDADGAGQTQDQVVVSAGDDQGNQQDGHQEGGEDTELRRCAEEDHRRVLQQGGKVDHRADGNKDEHREQLIGDARVKQDFQKSGFFNCAKDRGNRRSAACHQHRGQVSQDGAEADGQQERRFVVLLDGQVNQHARNDEHDQRFDAGDAEQKCDA